MSDPNYVESVLLKGAEKTGPVTEKVLKIVKNRVGLGQESRRRRLH